MNHLIPSEIRQLLAVIPTKSPFGERDHAMLPLTYFAGLRVGELVGLSVGLVWANGQPRSWLESSTFFAGMRKDVATSSRSKSSLRITTSPEPSTTRPVSSDRN